QPVNAPGRRSPAMSNLYSKWLSPTSFCCCGASLSVSSHCYRIIAFRQSVPCMKLSIDTNNPTPVFQQLVDQIHFKISAGELQPGMKLPSIRLLAADHNLAVNTVAKALRQLEFRGLIQAQDRSGYVVVPRDESLGRYQARGVSSDKTEVHNVVDKLDHGLFRNAFCK